MTDEQTKQNAEEYAKKIYHYTVGKAAAIRDFIAGAHSLDDEIKELKEEIESLQEQYNTCFDGFTKRGTKLGELMKENVKLRNDNKDLEQALACAEDVVDIQRKELKQLRNPCISVEERLPEEPLTICAVWLKGDDLVPHISLYDSGRFLLLPVDATVTHWMPIPETPLNK